METEKERKVIRCSKCGTTLAVVNGNEIALTKNQNGQPKKVEVKVTHDAGGRFDISCDCGGGFAFGRVAKTLSMEYVVKAKKEAEKPVDK